MTHDFDTLRNEMAQKEKELKSIMNGQINKLSGILKQMEFVKEKRTKLNKMQATMMLAHDNSIKLVFDNPEDAIKFYGK